MCQREAKNWEVGACGAGAAGSEIQPYLEGATEEAALSGGRRVAVRWSGTPGRGGPAYRAALWAVGTVPLPGVCECFVSRCC